MGAVSDVVELSPDPMLVADAAGDVVAANEAAERLLDCDGSTLADVSLSTVLRTAGTASEEPLTALSSEEVRRLGGDGTVFADCPDGRAIPVEVTLAAADVDGDRRLIATLRQERGGGRSDDSEERYRRLLEFSPAPIVIFDDEGRLVYANQAAADLHEVDAPADLIGTSGAEFIHPDDREAARGQVERVVEEGEALEGVHRRLLTADGETRHVVFSSFPASFDGEPAGQIVLSDVTELKERERELERQNERLDRFASIVSHDLRNPLSVLHGSLELTDCDDEHVERARRATDRMEELVDGLLTIARQGTTPEETTPVSIPDVARRAWETVDTAGADLVVETDATVDADESRVRELLENLFRNAVEHGSTSPRSSSTHEDAVEHGSTSTQSQAPEDAVEHDSTSSRSSSTHEDAVGREASDEPPVADTPGDAVEHGGDSLTVTVGEGPNGVFVADDGTGIPPSDRESVFETGVSTAEDGMGLGLAIVDEIAEAHGWTVTLTESTEGGARFEFACA